MPWGGNDAVMGSAGLGAGRSPAGQSPVSADEGFIPSFDRPAPAGGGGQAVEGAAAGPARSAAGDDGDWLTLSPASNAAAAGSGISTPWQPAKSAGGGAAMAPRGGSGVGGQATRPARGQVTPFRVPAPQQAAGGGGAGSSAALLAALGGSAQQSGAPAAPLPFAPTPPRRAAPRRAGPDASRSTGRQRRLGAHRFRRRRPVRRRLTARPEWGRSCPALIPVLRSIRTGRQRRRHAFPGR